MSPKHVLKYLQDVDGNICVWAKGLGYLLCERDSVIEALRKADDRDIEIRVVNGEVLLRGCL